MAQATDPKIAPEVKEQLRNAQKLDETVIAWFEGITQGNAAFAKLWLDEKRVRVDEQDGAGKTALCVAALAGHVPLIQLLLKAGASTSHQDGVGSLCA
jgi:ankyrin repeat protein